MLLSTRFKDEGQVAEHCVHVGQLMMGTLNCERFFALPVNN